MTFPAPRFENIPAGKLVFPPLKRGEIQLWAVRLDPERTRIDYLSAHLTAGEQERASRYYFDRDRRRFGARWGFVRLLLGHHLARAPADVRFTLGSKGKPYLADDPGLHFNLSHSGELALIGLGRDAQLGVDVEDARQIEDADGIAARFFAPLEAAAYFGCAESDRREVFFNCWTRKEAFVKASGDGITSPLDRFEVSILPGEAARVVTVDGEPERARGWTLIHLEPAPGFIGALAMRPAPLTISAWFVDLDRTAPQIAG